MANPPAFSALTTATRELASLLKCITFAPRAEVHLTPTGIRLSVEEARVVQGLTFLDKQLFVTYNHNFEDDAEEAAVIPPFEISISALLDTVQLFGLTDADTARNKHLGGGFTSSAAYNNAFSAPSLGLGGTCKFTYSEIGAPLSISMQEGSLCTTSSINTYTIGSGRDADDDGAIPFDRNAVCLKVIMHSKWLRDTILELATTDSDILSISASPRSQPYLSLEGTGGPFGDISIDFQPEVSKNESTPSIARNKKQPFIAETFSVAPPPGSHGRLKQRYSFELVKKAAYAMNLATKVSLRMDRQGVLSLQFMIETGGQLEGLDEKNGGGGGGGKASFVDYRFVPLVDDEDEDEDERDEEQEQEQEQEDG